MNDDEELIHDPFYSFEQRMEFVQANGLGGDKEDYYEWRDLQSLESAEESAISDLTEEQIQTLIESSKTW